MSREFWDNGGRVKMCGRRGRQTYDHECNQFLEFCSAVMYGQRTSPPCTEYQNSSCHVMSRFSALYFTCSCPKRQTQRSSIFPSHNHEINGARTARTDLPLHRHHHHHTRPWQSRRLILLPPPFHHP